MRGYKKIIGFLLGMVLIISLYLHIPEYFNGQHSGSNKYELSLSKEIDVSALEDMLEAKFPYATIVITDSRYFLTNKSEFDKLMEYDKTDEHKYISQIYDCDDFAFDFWRNISRNYHIAVGVIFYITSSCRAHAINFFIGEDLEIYFIEPQTDDYVNISGATVIFVLM